MDTILIILAAVTVLILIIVIAVLFKLKNKNNYRNDVHISGGVDIYTGQITSDNNYFKGMSNELRDTIVVGGVKQNSVHISLINMSSENQKTYEINLTDKIIIGRNKANGILTIDNDSMISHQHCALYLKNGNVYIEDLNSSNHTFLNDDIVLKPERCYDGDLIRVGQTNLMIQIIGG